MARTSRQLIDYACRNSLPFLCVRPGRAFKRWHERSVETVELRRSRLAFRVEADLWQAPAILRCRRFLRRRFADFQPDVVHVTAMGDFGLFGSKLAREFGLPIVASWHTNVHEYAYWRFARAGRFLPLGLRRGFGGGIERCVLNLCLRSYHKSAVGAAPNLDPVELLRAGTDKPAFLLERGVDTGLFHPSPRVRADHTFVCGYVGRLGSEKNLRLLKCLEDSLEAHWHRDYRIEIVGHGAESDWLRRKLRRARLPGVLYGRALAEAYATMDVFLFPSHTDTYGNVVWEALASGLPAVVTNSGGPQYIVRHETTGLGSRSDDEFIQNAISLYRDPIRRRRMGATGREAALRQSWEAVFDRLYAVAYRTAVAS